MVWVYDKNVYKNFSVYGVAITLSTKPYEELLKNIYKSDDHIVFCGADCKYK